MRLKEGIVIWCVLLSEFVANFDSIFVVSQALFHVPAFVKWLMSDSDHMKKCEQINGQGYGDCITCSMARTFRMSQNHMSVKPYLITNKLRSKCRICFPSLLEVLISKINLSNSNYL